MILTRTVSMNFSPKCLWARPRGHYLWNARSPLFGVMIITKHRPPEPWFQDGFPNLINHQIWKDRGKKRTRTQDDHITFKNRFHHFLTSLWTLLIKVLVHKHDQSCRYSWQCGFLLLFLFHLERQHEGSRDYHSTDRSCRLYGKISSTIAWRLCWTLHLWKSLQWSSFPRVSSQGPSSSAKQVWRPSL